MVFRFTKGEGMREEAEGTWEPLGFLVTEEGELVPGTRSGTDARGQGLRRRSHPGPWTQRA